MTTAVVPAPGPGFTPGPARWTCDEFHRLWDSGALEGKWVILVDGEMLAMPAPNLPHDASLELTAEWLRGVFTPGCWVRVQMGLVLGVNTDPIPDVAVVPGSPRTLTQTPRSALLVVEVAESSLAYDTGEKASLYAAAGIEDYWVIDVEHRRLLVFRGPMADPNQKYGHRYAQVAALDPADTVAPLAMPNNSVKVGDLLP